VWIQSPKNLSRANSREDGLNGKKQHIAQEIVSSQDEILYM